MSKPALCILNLGIELTIGPMMAVKIIVPDEDEWKVLTKCYETLKGVEEYAEAKRLMMDALDFCSLQNWHATTDTAMVPNAFTPEVNQAIFDCCAICGLNPTANPADLMGE